MLRKKKQVSPEQKQILLELEEVVAKLGFRVRFEKGNFRGGHCIVKEEKLFLINSRFEPDKKISTLARSLNQFNLEDIFIKPHIRELIEKESRSKEKPEELELENTE
jgi:hypothetical protein